MWRNFRRIYQALFFGIFVFLVLVTTASFIGGYPVEWFLAIDPLAATSTALANRHLDHHLLWAVPLLIITIVFGRFFCGWMCPFGSLHHLVGLLGYKRKPRERIETNRPRKAYKTKYFILMVMLLMAVGGSTQIGWLDPIAFLWRAMTTVIVPAIDHLTGDGYQGPRHFHASTVITACLLAALSLNLFVPRLYCRLLCPLGALLGVLSRLSLFRVRRDLTVCTDCKLCGADCAGAADPQGALRINECLLCMNCVAACPRGGMSYSFLRSPSPTTETIDLKRRHSLAALIAGLAAVPLLRTSDGVGPKAHPQRIRPPGAQGEEEFLELCLKCGACMKACPTGGLQPAWNEAGFEGVWTPILVPRLGYCEQGCVLCTEVCPTGAIRPLSLAEKLGQAPATEPVRIGSAFIDRGRCLPWAVDTQCIVCEEVCPTSPKAVYFKSESVILRDGSTQTLKRPYVDLNLCVGCGTCEAQCPVADRAAIRITSVGESRSRRNRVVVTGGRL